jgi:protein-L-isoaspartate(D-aspartate) O-methyltransferase
MDMTVARAAMIDSQVRPNDVTDRRLIAAMAAVPREAFLPAERSALAYADRVAETGPGRHLWAPRDFAKLVQAAAVGPDDRVLDIAPGAGYSSAVLARLAGSVTALEADGEAASALASRLASLGAEGVAAVAGPLAAGWGDGAPYDVIFVNGAVELVPEAWTEQLAEGGRLALAMWEGGVKRAGVFMRTGGVAAWRAEFECAAPELPGFRAPETFRF